MIAGGVVAVALALCAVFALAGPNLHKAMRGAEAPASSTQQQGTQSAQGAASAAPASSAAEPSTITLLGAGDNMQHSPMITACQTEDGYDFKPLYTQIKPVVSAADIAFVNQEAPIDPGAEPEGYPAFNAAPEMGDALADAGFDVISESNNHMLDQGADGLQATIDYWKGKSGITQVGAYENDEDMRKPRIVEKNGFRVAYLAMTEMTNGLSLPEDSKLRILYTSETDTIQQLIQDAKKQADLVVVSVHWGTEDTFDLTDEQTGLAQNMVNWGADVIFGNHPHALQKLTTLKRAGDGAACPVIYAFGNLISTQYDPWNLVSGLLTVTYQKDAGGKPVFQGMQFKPVVTYYEGGAKNIHVQWLKDFTDEMAQQSLTWDKTGGEFTPEYARSVVDQSIPKEYQDWT